MGRWLRKLLIIIAVFTVLHFVVTHFTQEPDADLDLPPTAALDYGPPITRREFLNYEKLLTELIANGFVKKVVPGRDAVAWVRQLFYEIDFDDKAIMAAGMMEYARYRHRRCKQLILLDARTGRQVGRYSRDRGLRME